MRYSDAVMEHFLRPRHVGVMNSSDADVGTGEAGSYQTGALIRIQLKVSERGQIQESCFKAYGCGCTIAAASFAAQWLQDRSLEQAAQFSSTDVQQALELPPVKVHCALLVQEAVQAAVASVQNKGAF
ncbi:iron-sulfur cluster assembly scaffold protein [Alcaligenes aquatilis]|uniref:iron-sulfur cluster assembly scaffold protein n=1 Tax=Alcaligenes aquatilis TaxID=323284 RepID=UPI00361D1208